MIEDPVNLNFILINKRIYFNDIYINNNSVENKK